MLFTENDGEATSNGGQDRRVRRAHHRGAGGQEYLAKVKNNQMTVILVEKDEKQRASLDAELKAVAPAR
jgi:hypothetical protein